MGITLRRMRRASGLSRDGRVKRVSSGGTAVSELNVWHLATMQDGEAMGLLPGEPDEEGRRIPGKEKRRAGRKRASARRPIKTLAPGGAWEGVEGEDCLSENMTSE